MPEDEISPEQKEVERLVEQALASISEYCDTVHVFVTRYNGATGNTVHYSTGTGNWFARSGQIKDWLIKEDERTRKYARKYLDEDD